VDGEKETETMDALRRTRLANERTYLAWWRSALAAFAVALGVGKIVPQLTSGSTVGYEIVGVGYAALGVAFISYGYVRERRQEAALREGRFAEFGPVAAAAFTIAGIALGLATVLVVIL
jgi:putative membrane protein